MALFVTAGGLLLCASSAWAQVDADTDAVEVDAIKVLHAITPQVLGINLNYLSDDDHNRPAQSRHLLSALRELAVHCLRVQGGPPGGSYGWASPPFATAKACLLRTGSGEWPSQERRLVAEDGRTLLRPALEFDQVLQLCRSLEAELVVVVPLDAIYRPVAQDGTRPTREQLLALTQSWVRYAGSSGVAVRRWEIGEAPFLAQGEGAPTARSYCEDLQAVAAAIRAVDPKARIIATGPPGVRGAGASGRGPGPGGDGESWWREVLRQAGPQLDLVSVRLRPCEHWQSYAEAQLTGVRYDQPLDALHAALQEELQATDQHRVRLAVGEWQAGQREGAVEGWANRADLGHALVSFEILGSLLERSDLDSACMWATRSALGGERQGPFEALAADNSLTPSGRSLSIWGQFLRANLVQARGTAAIHAWASAGLGRLSIFLLNGGGQQHEVELSCMHTLLRHLTPWILSGTGPDDLAPTWQRNDQPVELSQGHGHLGMPPYSVVVLEGSWEERTGP